MSIAPGFFGRLISAGPKASYQLLDIGEQGMCLVSRDPACGLDVGQKVTFAVKPRRVLGFSAAGRVAWVRRWKKDKTAYKVIGVEFLDLDEKIRAVLRLLFYPAAAGKTF